MAYVRTGFSILDSLLYRSWHAHIFVPSNGCRRALKNCRQGKELSAGVGMVENNKDLHEIQKLKMTKKRVYYSCSIEYMNKLLYLNYHKNCRSLLAP